MPIQNGILPEVWAGLVQISALKGSYGRFKHKPATGSTGGPYIFESRELGGAAGEYPTSYPSHHFCASCRSFDTTGPEHSCRDLFLDDEDDCGPDTTAEGRRRTCRVLGHIYVVSGRPDHIALPGHHRSRP